ncbi:hypothetical protein [Nostoc sp.]
MNYAIALRQQSDTLWESLLYFGLRSKRSYAAGFTRSHYLKRVIA